jgi:dTDP-4-dehydrorhamnose 3,5-epimerase
MRLVAQPLHGVHLLQPTVFADQRGDFVKTYHTDAFNELGIAFDPVEEFYSTSKRGVIRGMHFQLPPYDHAKLVYCIRGCVLDVLLDLRRDSESYGRYTSLELSGENHLLLYIPTGVAHGFLALKDDSVMIYKTSSVHAPSHDSGVRWDSFGFDWGISNAVISDRDRALFPLGSFTSLF